MKKAVLFAIVFIIMISCKKDNVIKTDTKQTENSRQLLTKVVKTTNLSSDISYDDVINYEYNSAGKIITEGNKTYFRDDKQRIVRILDPGTGTNRDDINVYYSNPESNKIAYTLCILVGGEAIDSVVYLHDEYGRLIKTTSYFSYISGANSPGAVLSHFTVFQYDEMGNIEKLNLYNVDNGKVFRCGQYHFMNYDKMINPQYAADEVRAMEFSYDGIINASKNNLTGINGYTKSYEYRTDGRPRSCMVKQNGTPAFKLTFEYK